MITSVYRLLSENAPIQLKLHIRMSIFVCPTLELNHISSQAVIRNTKDHTHLLHAACAPTCKQATIINLG